MEFRFDFNSILFRFAFFCSYLLIYFALHDFKIITELGVIIIFYIQSESAMSSACE